MSDYKTFSKTVRGYFHKVNGLPLEDASQCYSEEDPQNGEFYIVAIADGHGDPACVRSDRGAQEAVMAAKDCLTDFAKEALKREPGETGEPQLCEKLLLAKSNRDGEEMLARQSRVILRQLTDTIISRWYDALEADIERYPFSSEEMAAAGIDEEDYTDADNRARICTHTYGTTLIAALMLPELLILIQQGDGLCEVLYEKEADVVIERPLPPDDRCFKNMTSSLCDLDASERIRSWVLDLRDKKIAACYLSSDGVENSFSDEDGIHMFYRKLSCELLCGEENDCEKLLEALSIQGSGDDMSVGVIYNHPWFCKHKDVFQLQINRYELEWKLAEYEGRKASMSRKYEILQKRAAEAAENLNNWRKRTQSRRAECARMKEMLDQIDLNMELLTKNVDEIRHTTACMLSSIPVECFLWEYNPHTGISEQRKQQLYPSYTRNNSKKYRKKLLQAERELSRIYAQHELRRSELAERITLLEKVENTEKSRLESQLETARAEYDGYARDYQSLEMQIAAIQKQIAALEQDERANILSEVEETSHTLLEPDEMLTSQFVQPVQPEEQSILENRKPPLNSISNTDETHIGGSLIYSLDLPHFDAES